MSNFERTPELLERASYGVIYDLMVTQRAPRDDRYTVPVEASFTGAMAYLSDIKPEIYLLTHASAVPVADSIRAYYAVLGVELPELGVINTKEENRENEYITNMDFTRTKDPQPSDEVIDRELKKLKDIDGKRVAIVDQAIENGGTLKRAKVIADLAGATEVRYPLKANWYHGTIRSEVDTDAITSVHAEHMRKIGHDAAQFVLPSNWREAYRWQIPEDAYFRN